MQGCTGSIRSEWANIVALFLFAAVVGSAGAADPGPGPGPGVRNPTPVSPQVMVLPRGDVNDPDIEKRQALDDILVLVNSVPIYSHSLDNMVSQLIKAANKQPTPVEMHNVRKGELQNLVQMEVTRQFVKVNNLKLDQKKFDQYIDFLNKEATTRFGEPLQAVLRRNGRDYPSWKKAQEYVFLLRDFASGQLTEKSIDAYIKDKLETLPLRRVRHILIAHQDSVKYAIPGRTKDQAKARCEEILARLKAGEAFAELAMGEGESPEALDGGLLPFLAQKPNDPALDLAKPFVAAVYKLEKIGDYTLQPVETDYGFHLIQLIDIRRDIPNPVHPQSNLRKYLMNTPEHYNALVENKWQETIDEVRRKSTIQFFGEFDDMNEKPLGTAPKAPDQPAGDLLPPVPAPAPKNTPNAP